MYIDTNARLFKFVLFESECTCTYMEREHQRRFLNENWSNTTATALFCDRGNQAGQHTHTGLCQWIAWWEVSDGKYPTNLTLKKSFSHYQNLTPRKLIKTEDKCTNSQTKNEHALTWWCHPCVIPGGSPWPLHYVQIRQTVHVYPQHLHQLGRHVHTNRAKTNKCTSCNFGTNMAMQ